MKRLLVVFVLSFMAGLFGLTEAKATPTGYTEFCSTHKAAICHNMPDVTNVYTATGSTNKHTVTLNELIKVNTQVNDDMTGQLDSITYGVKDKWAYPGKNGVGDCEDYALVKARTLSQMGVKQSQLKMVIGFYYDGKPETSWKGDHAVLLVNLDGTDYVLDSKHDFVFEVSDYRERFGVKFVEGQDSTGNWVKYQ